jgi:hypothetical protein
MSFLRGLLSDAPGSPSITRFALALVLLLLLLVIGRWLATGVDVPSGIRGLMEVALGSTLVAKVGQKFAENK